MFENIMSELELVKWAVLGIFGFFGWMVKSRVESVENRMSKQEGELASVKASYLHKDDFREFKAELKGMFEDLKRDLRELKEHNKNDVG